MATITHVVNEIVKDYRRYFPEASAPPSIRSMTVTARPLSDLGRVELGFRDAARTIYVKIPRRTPDTMLQPLDRKARLEFETLRALYEGFQAVPGCAVVRPIGFFAAQAAVVTEAGPGVNLHRLVKARAAVWRPTSHLALLEQASYQCGVWLTHFQALTQRPATYATPWDAVFKRFQGDVERCVKAGLPAADGRRLLEACEAEMMRLRGTAIETAGTHPDFQPDNVLVSRDGVTVLDFASFHHGPIWADPARFAVTVAFVSRTPYHPRARTNRLIGAFFRGCGASLTANTAGMNVYALRSMVRVVAGACRPSPSPLHGLRRRWALGFLAAWPQVLDTIGRLAAPAPRQLAEQRP